MCWTRTIDPVADAESYIAYLENQPHEICANCGDPIYDEGVQIADKWYCNNCIRKLLYEPDGDDPAEEVCACCGEPIKDGDACFEVDGEYYCVDCAARLDVV